jgi:outer membrane protein TolC
MLSAQSEALEAAAAQRPNPEAASNAVFGDSQDQIEVSVLHTIETAGKRGRRIDRARAEALELKAEALATREELAVETVVALFRLRQIRDELRLLVEAAETFSTISKQLRSRRHRSPEQQVSLSVFQLAGQDYSVRRAALESEEAALRRRLELGIGTALPASAEVLPGRPLQWPDPGAVRDASSFRGSAVLRAAAAIQVARADVGAARAAAYPDIRLGPSLLNQKNGPGEGQSTLLGAGLSLPIPLYHRNAGGRRLAVRAAETATSRAAAVSAVLASERDAELARYRAATAVLARLDGKQEVESEHEQMEGLFERGVVPAALVIEAHRQMVDYTTDVNQQELIAVKALWTIYAIEGRALTEKL